MKCFAQFIDLTCRGFQLRFLVLLAFEQDRDSVAILFLAVLLVGFGDLVGDPCRFVLVLA